MNVSDGLMDGLLVFSLGILIALLRFAWIGYWRTHQDEFIQLTPKHEGNQIFVKTPKRKRRGSHMIVITEQVDEGSVGDEENSELTEEEEEGAFTTSASSQEPQEFEMGTLPGDALLQNAAGMG